MRTLWTVAAIGAIVLILGVGMYRMMPHRTGTQTAQDGLPASTTPTIEPFARSVSNLQYVVAKRDGAAVTFSGVDSDGTQTDIVRVSDDLTGTVHGVLSPDTRTLFLSDPSGSVLSYDIASGTAHPLLAAAGNLDDPNASAVNRRSYQILGISPDGSTLALRPKQDVGLALIHADGSGYHELQGAASDSWLAFSPDSKQLAITQYPGASASVYVAPVSDPEHGKALLPASTSDSESFAFEPAWSPDGMSLAFSYYARTPDTEESASVDTNPVYQREVYAMNSDGSDFHQVTTDASYSTDTIWTDSNTLLYGLSNIYAGNKQGIFSSTASGKSNASVFSSDAKSYVPLALSPDGTQLSYQYGEPMNEDMLGILNLHTKQSVGLGQGVDFVGWVHRP